MPFSMEEFLARVRSSIRRWSNYVNSQQIQDNKPEEDLLMFSGLRIDLLGRKVFLNNEIIRLTPTEYDILVYLAQKQGRVVTHREILRSIWGIEYGDEREYLRVFISQLRKKLDDNSLEPKYIVTEPGVGYRFEG
jgi:two-component system KDP operon response regulator KdpE